MKLFSQRDSFILISFHGESHMYEYLPGWPEPTEKEIIRLCLCHTSYLHKSLKLYIYIKQKNSLNSRSSHQRCSIEKAVLKNFSIFTGKHLCWSFFFLKACCFIKRNSNTGVFLWILRIFYVKNTYSEENLLTTVSEIPSSNC